jgi:transcriptional regulator
MAADTNWRSASNYQYLSDLNPAELAWEFLRRNPDYEQEVAATDPTDERAATALTAHWGLRFPDSAKPVRHRRRDFLEPGRRPNRPHPGASDGFNHVHGECHHRSGRRPSGG